MLALAENTTIKLGMEHNICSLKLLSPGNDLNQIVLSVKQNIEMRLGSSSQRKMMTSHISNYKYEY